jgi:homoserine dehydrogenase
LVRRLAVDLHFTPGSDDFFLVKIALQFVGFGNVARRFVQLLDETRPTLTALGIEPVVVGITTRRHGGVFEAAGLDAIRAARIIAEGGVLSSTPAPSTDAWAAQLRSRSTEARVVFETTTLDVRSGEPAIQHVRAAFTAGAHVVTANKGPVAFAYRALAEEARAAGVSFLFEGAVMDGLPVFNLVRETMPGVTIRGFRGVVNSTTNHILTALEAGEGFAPALERMQADGVAEADASLDVDGWDAAAKAAALANVWLDADLTPLHVRREGINEDTGERARAVRAAGRRLKLVAYAYGRGDQVKAAVELEELAPDDPLAVLDGQGNALEIDTWPLGRIVITQRDGGLEKTAYALLSDLITIGKQLGAGSKDPASIRS